MKKQITIALALLISALSLAQKKELKAAEKAIKSDDFAGAKTALAQAESLMSAMDEKLKSKYYYLKGQALYAKGKGTDTEVKEAIENLGKAESAYSTEVATFKKNMANDFLKIGNEAYNAKDYSKASNYFEKSYRASKTDTLFLYYAAATAVNVKEYDKALKLYEELKDLGYTGIETQYFATNVASGKEEVLDANTRDLYVKAKSHIKPGERKTESKRPEIVKNVALIYVSNGDNDKALEAMKEAREQSPGDVNLILTEANVHYKMGNKEEFKSLLQKATALDPKNPELQYNLGVIASESEELEEAKKHYEKAIALDPDYVNAYINLSALVLAREKPLIDEMNNLGTSAADNKRYDELKEERQDLYKTAIPYLSKALAIDDKNISAAKTLMNIYSSLGETDKFQELKAKIATLEE